MSSPRRRSIMGPPAPESPPLAALALPSSDPSLIPESNVSVPTSSSNTSHALSANSPATSIPTSPTLGNKAVSFSSSSPSKSVLSPEKAAPAAPKISPSSSLRRRTSTRYGLPAPASVPLAPSWPPHSAAQDRISADPGLVLRNARLLLAEAAAAAAAQDANAHDNAHVLTVDYTSTDRYLFHKRALFPSTPMLHPAEHDRKPKKPVQQKKKTARLSGQNRAGEPSAQTSATDASTQNSATDASAPDSVTEDLTRGTTPEVDVSTTVAAVEAPTLFEAATHDIPAEALNELGTAELTQDVAAEAETLPEAETHDSAAEMSTQALDAPNTSAEAPPAVAKRGRGRPRKYPRPGEPGAVIPAVVFLRAEDNPEAGAPSPGRTEDSEPPVPALRRPVGRPRKHPRPEDVAAALGEPPAKRPRGRPRKLAPEVVRWTAVVGRLVKGKARLTPELLAGVNSVMDAMEMRKRELTRELLEDGLLDMVALLAEVEENELYSLGALRDRARALVVRWQSTMATQEIAREGLD